jgi:hypothetical protein
MASTVPAVKAALLTLLQARPALSSVLVSWSGPTRDEDFTTATGAVEMVFLGDANSDETWQDLSPQLRRTETYRLGVTVYAERWGDDPQATEQRVYALWDEVTDTLRDDIAPGGAGTLRAAGLLDYGQITFRQTTAPAAGDKWGARLDGQISFRARNV